MNDEALRKWNPIFDSLDPKQTLDLADRGYLAEFAEQFSFNIIQDSMHTLLPNGLDPTELLPAFLKIILELKTKYNFEFLYNDVVPTERIAVDIPIGEFIKPVYNTENDRNLYFDAIFEKLEELYSNNKVIVHNINLMVIDITGMPIPTVFMKCTLFPNDVAKVEAKVEKNFQECAHLEIEDVFATSKNTLADLYNLQKDIQENVYGYDFKAMQEGPLSELVKFWQWNIHAQIDEIHEGMDALGGIKDGIGNAVWKPWKQANKDVPNMSFINHSESDKKELKMELIDELHFLFNKMLSVGMTPEELMNFYYSKNEENRRRQSTGTY